MRKIGLVFIVLLLSLAGFLYQVRLAETLPNMRGMLPLGCGLLLFAVAAIAFAHGRVRALLATPWVHYCLAATILAALAVFGRRYRGGIYLPGRINPSEFVKLFFVLFAAGYLARARADDGRLTIRKLAILAVAFGFIAAEIAVVHDFGLLAQLALTLTAILFAASWGWGLAAVAGVGIAAMTAMAHPTGHLAVRFAVWRDPFADMTGAGWQTLQGLAALVSGGWWGKGMGLGEVHAVPIVSSDFVYAALAEEVGLVGCAILLIMWLLFFVFSLYPFIWGQSPLKSGGQTLLKSRGQSPLESGGQSLLAVGLVSSLGIQLMLNIAGVLNALPMTGITLPLLSHGGSSLVAVLLMCGLLIANVKCEM